jgi:hypothetical protein
VAKGLCLDQQLSGSDAIDLLALVCDGVIPSRWCYNWTEYAESKLGISQNVIDELFCAYGYVSACANGGSVTPGMVADKVDSYLAGDADLAAKILLLEKLPEERRRCGDWLFKFIRGEVKVSGKSFNDAWTKAELCEGATRELKVSARSASEAWLEAPDEIYEPLRRQYRSKF